MSNDIRETLPTQLISPADIDIDHLLPPYTPAKVQALSQWFEY